MRSGPERGHYPSRAYYTIPNIVRTQLDASYRLGALYESLGLRRYACPAELSDAECQELQDLPVLTPEGPGQATEIRYEFERHRADQRVYGMWLICL